MDPCQEPGTGGNHHHCRRRGTPGFHGHECCSHCTEPGTKEGLFSSIFRDVGCLIGVTVFYYVFTPQKYFWGLLENAFGLTDGQAGNLQKYLASALTFGAGLYIANSVFRRPRMAAKTSSDHDMDDDEAEEKPVWVTIVLKISMIGLFLMSFYYMYLAGLFDSFLKNIFECQHDADDKEGVKI